ncbi:SDR family oxidoreductase [Siphonobacter sp. SORGH_AS_1065]|uniref:SDR family NAD(P)-dependent oxidoreductase n=1 Tax=Siphonobacter sp. SORGH_AS_1065 TaxID=3041795 RepID=UPI00278397F5|nr:SDR family oxidoreductase [Siphonobacter sp. SORGH_AS_1065]MDQ1088404.1 short-subunit dehydrogenase [Siphonobacter sp. SORGH_AS_1065]
MSDLKSDNAMHTSVGSHFGRPWIVVTGGTKGIGKAIIRRFVKDGFDAITVARNAEDLEQFKKETEQEFPGSTLLTYTADLGERSQLEAFAAYVKSQNRPLELLVNNTGLFLPGEIHQEEEGTFEFLMNVNVASAYHLTRALLPNMLERQRGYLVNVCSTASITAYTNGGSYCISKFALLGMTKVLREELKTKGIKVTAVLPGAVYTNSWAGTDLPESRFMQPEDVAELLWTSYHLSPSAVVEEILIRPQLGDI